MVDKVAVPFWLCWSVGMVVGAATGDFAFWLVLTGMIGFILGLIAAVFAKRKKWVVYHATAQSPVKPIDIAHPADQLEPAA